VLCSNVHDKLFGPMELSRRDLGALNIMRGRDNSLPDYNTVRYVFFLQMPRYLSEAGHSGFIPDVGMLLSSLPSLHCF
jgi:hypothetical protein